MAQLRFVCWNLERNGAGDPEIRRAAAETLRRLQPDIVFRQEMSRADERGHTIFNEQCRELDMQGVLGTGACTAILFNLRRFHLVRDWSGDRGPHFVLPPTAITLSFTEAGPDAPPFNAVSFHFAYASADSASWRPSGRRLGPTRRGRLLTAAASYCRPSSAATVTATRSRGRRATCPCPTSPLSRTGLTVSTGRAEASTVSASRTPSPTTRCALRASKTSSATGPRPRAATRPRWPAPSTPARLMAPTAGSTAYMSPPASFPP